MEGEEERGSVGEENSQKDAAADETRRQTERSQTPQLRSDRGSDDDDDKEDEREEQTSGSLWGHARLPPSVYGNNPPPGGKRMGKAKRPETTKKVPQMARRPCTTKTQFSVKK
jgi:hypothetical protein